MADRLTPDQRRLNMSRVRAKDTRPELAVRRLLHHHGLRFRLHRRDLPGKPDIVLPRWDTALFVHGCFWHGHGCSLFRLPTTRAQFWSEKIAANRMRDIAAVDALGRLGWRTLLIWECAMKGRGRLPETVLTERLIAFLGSDDMTGEIAETAVSGVAATVHPAEHVARTPS